jgi:hypothetical protein
MDEVSETPVARVIRLRRAYDTDRNLASEWLAAENRLTDDEYVEYQRLYSEGKS